MLSQVFHLTLTGYYRTRNDNTGINPVIVSPNCWLKTANGPEQNHYSTSILQKISTDLFCQLKQKSLLCACYNLNAILFAVFCSIYIFLSKTEELDFWISLLLTQILAWTMCQGRQSIHLQSKNTRKTTFGLRVLSRQKAAENLTSTPSVCVRVWERDEESKRGRELINGH